MKDWLKKNFMRVWVSGVAGLGFGALVEMLWSVVSSKDIHGFVMLPLMIGGAIAVWFVLKNNNGFGKV